MIRQFRDHIEGKQGIPVHWVAINESEVFPCATLRKSLLDTHHALQHANGWAVTGVELTVYALDYEELDTIADGLRERYDGWLAPLTEGRGKVKIKIDDEDDDAFPAPDGADDWIYAREITIRIHHRTNEGVARGRRKHST